jgi:UDP-N-acetylmuramate dehydrogenase
MSWTTGLEHLLSEQAPLAQRTWLGLGGPAEFLARPSTQDELVDLVQRCRQEDLGIRLLGAGSNIVIREQGVAGVVVDLSAGAFSRVSVDQQMVTCGGGTKLAHLISESVGAGLAGLEPLVGIPGTVGGALHGNTGSHGGDIGQWTASAIVLTRSGELIHRQRGDLVFAYRQSSLDELAILEARFELEEEDPQILARRMQKQWIATKACQPAAHEASICVFKDAPGVSAEMLVAQAVSKGMAAGGAELSTRHPNYILAHPGATSADVLALVDQLRNTIAVRTGIELPLQLEIW